MARLASALAPGSYLAISHLTADFAPEQVTAAAEAYNTQVPVPVTARTHTQVTALFGGLPLLAPGVVPITQWRPRIGQLPQPADLHAGVARIPGPRSGPAPGVRASGVLAAGHRGPQPAHPGGAWVSGHR